MSMSEDQKELNELLSGAKKVQRLGRPKGRARDVKEGDSLLYQDENNDLKFGFMQWATSDNTRFFPASHTMEKIFPGVYEIAHSNTRGIYFQKIPVKTEGLVRFPQTNSDRVLDEIKKFWDRESHFHKYGLTHKRGIILYGPAGGGKSSLIQLIIKDIIDRGGIVIKFVNPGVFLEGMRIFREVEKETPCVVLMEDIDSTIEIYNESEVLNILDGVDRVEKICFLATTNYPERLGARIINRPSRFDKRFKIGNPNAQSRRLYFEHIIGKDTIEELNISLSRWVKDTEGMSIAHLKELFVAVVILGDEYEEAIDTLKQMKETYISSVHDEDRVVGFARGRAMCDDEGFGDMR